MSSIWKYSVIKSEVTSDIETMLNHMALKGWEPIQLSTTEGFIIVLCRKLADHGS